MAAHHALELRGLAGNEASAVHRLDPRAKLAGLLGVTLVAVSAPLARWPVFLACAAVLAGVALAGAVPADALWRRARLVLVPVLAVAAVVPLARTGGDAVALGPLRLHETGLAVAAATAAKATIGATAAALMAGTTTTPAVLHGLAALRVPRLLVLIAALMHRYLLVIAGEAARMRAALAARGFRPRHALQAAALGRLAGALFLRSVHRGERVHLAMLARGHRGALPSLDVLAFGRADALFVLAVLVVPVALRVAPA